MIPAPAPGGNVPASGGKVPNDLFEKYATFRDGVLVDLEPPREFFNVSKISAWTVVSHRPLAGKQKGSKVRTALI